MFGVIPILLYKRATCGNYNDEENIGSPRNLIYQTFKKYRNTNFETFLQNKYTSV